MFLGPQLKDFNKLISQGQGKAKDSVLIVGPWGHGKAGDGSVDYGKGLGRADILGVKHQIDWFDYHLNGADNGIDELPKVKIFVMGDNVWREENEWPLARNSLHEVLHPFRW